MRSAVKSGQRLMAEEEYQRRLAVATVFLDAAEHLQRAWWSVGIRATTRSSHLEESNLGYRELRSQARADEGLVLTVAQDTVFHAANRFGEWAADFDVQRDYAAQLNQRRRHSGTLLLLALNDTEWQDWPEDVLERGTESLDDVAAAPAMQRWWRRIHPRSMPPRSTLRNEYLRAALAVLAAWLDHDLDDRTREDDLQRLTPGPGAYPQAVRGGAYPGFDN